MNGRVEFCGVPGSGKSTLCAEAATLLRRRGRDVLDRTTLVNQQLRKRDFGWIANTIAAGVPGWRKAFLGLAHGMDDWIRFVVHHPEYAALIHAWIAENGRSESWRRAVFHAVANTAHEFQLASEGHKFVLMDESFAQRFFSLQGYGTVTKPNHADRYAETMPLPSALVVMMTPPALCLDRVRQRPAFPLLMQQEAQETLPLRFDEGTHLLTCLGVALQKRNLPVLFLEGKGDTTSAAQTIVNFIETVL